MFFEELIEQHRVHLVIAHGVGVSFFVERHQVGICFRHLLGDQTELPAPVGVVLVVEGNRLESQNGLAGLIHRFDIVLESPRRGLSAEPSPKIDSHWKVIGVNRRFKDIADIEAVAHVLTSDADTDHVVGCSDVGAGVCAQRDAVAASAIGECAITDGRVVAAVVVQTARSRRQPCRCCRCH